jgi:hypothetical protein
MGYGRLSAEILCAPLPSRWADLSRFRRAVRFAGHAVLPVRPQIFSIRARSFASPKPFHHEAASDFWQENVGNSDLRISGDGVAALRRKAFGAGHGRWLRPRSRCTAAGAAESRSTASSLRCARPAPTCSRSTGNELGRACGEFCRVLTRAGGQISFKPTLACQVGVIPFLPRRRSMAPSTLKPASIIAQVEGSGTDDPTKSIDTKPAPELPPVIPNAFRAVLITYE